MAVHTSIFGGVRLTDEDAKAFRKQIDEGRPSQAAKDALKAGRKMVAEYKEKGFVRIAIKKQR